MSSYKAKRLEHLTLTKEAVSKDISQLTNQVKRYSSVVNPHQELARTGRRKWTAGRTGVLNLCLSAARAKYPPRRGGETGLCT